MMRLYDRNGIMEAEAYREFKVYIPRSLRNKIKVTKKYYIKDGYLLLKKEVFHYEMV